MVSQTLSGGTGLSIGQTSVGVSIVVVVPVVAVVGVVVVAAVVVPVVVGAKVVVVGVVVPAVAVVVVVVGGFVAVVVVVGSPPRIFSNQFLKSLPYWRQARKPSTMTATAAIPAPKNFLRLFFGGVVGTTATGFCSAPQCGQYV